ncbi:hypothetical protein BGZ49_002922, partial [Haplosporangium sp. Z 27]
MTSGKPSWDLTRSNPMQRTKEEGKARTLSGYDPSLGKSMANRAWWCFLKKATELDPRVVRGLLVGFIPSEVSSWNVQVQYAGQSNLDRWKNYTCRYAVRRIVCSNSATPKPDREHPPMKLFRFKEHIEQDNTKEEVKAKKRKKWKPKAIPTNPHELVKAMTRAHQAATLTVGTLKANTKQLKLKSAQERAILKCIKDHVQVGNLIKRRAQVALA